MQYLPGARRVAGFLLIGLLAGCSGGNGSDTDNQTQVSTNSLTFSAASPTAAAPAAQSFTATFGEAIAHLAVVHSGDAIASATSVVNGRTAQITVVPATPSNIGPGPFVGAVAVTGYTCADATCSRMSAGSTATVSVAYQISPVIERVAPYVVPAGIADTVIVRGLGFRSFNVSGVRLGDTSATSFTVNTGGTEISVAHPALAAGTYAVRVDASNHTGEIPSTTTLLVRDPVAFAATTLSYPTAATAIRGLFFDFERSALLAVTNATGGPIVRYPYASGAWGAPAEVAGSLLDAALSNDGTRIFGITATTLVPIDPVTLALGTAVTAPSLATNSALKNIVVGNDTRALITTSLTTSGTTQGYIYNPQNASLTQNGVALNNATPVMAGNGNSGIVVQGDPTLTSDVAVYAYSVPAGSLSASTLSLRQNAIRPAVDRTATRVILNGRRVYDSNLSLLGTLPETTTAVALSPNGRRAYAYDATAGGILVYDVSVDRDEGAYTALGAVVPLAGSPGADARMIITPDGNTLFIAGGTQIVVQPTPSL